MTRRARIGIALISVAVPLVGCTMAIEVRHHSEYRHWISYGWHVDVISERTDNGPFESGVQHLQRAQILNFTPFPGPVEACIVPNDATPYQTPVFPFRIEKIEKATGNWIVFPLSNRPSCLNLPIRSKFIWPSRSFSTIAVPFAGLSWFRKGDWVRLVALSKCDKPTEPHREFTSPRFQLTEDREQ